LGKEPKRTAEFRLSIGDKESVGVFREVSGLDSESEVPEERSGRGSDLRRVQLKRGEEIDPALLEWLETARKEGPEAARVDATITLIDYRGATIGTYALKRAWPSKIDPPDFNAKGTDVAMEELTVSYERLEME
jgi:phage tail-like protein